MFRTTSTSNSVKCARLKGPPLTQDISALIGGLISTSVLSECAAPGESMIDAREVLRAVASAAPRLHSDNRIAWLPDTASSARLEGACA
jgi:hypothetical protein